MAGKSKMTRREAARAQARRREVLSRVLWGGAGLLVVAIVAFLVFQAVRPGSGETVVLHATARNHVPDGTQPGPFVTDPPTGGAHYASTLPVRFYEEVDLAGLGQYPEGYLAHNLEHGHVIFWYNCAVLDEQACGSLKANIRQVMEEFDNFKVLAFPWTTMREPLVMTSWDRIQRFEDFDRQAARNFVRSNRNRAPEPNAP